jgi:ribulose-5-phosphate 4-epimerase/fuculose-1-phosphate aldolase
MGFHQDREIVENIAQACRVLGAYDMTEGATGHVSYRVEGSDEMFIKGKGPNQVGLRYTQPRDIVKIDFDAEMMDGPDGLQPPSESFLHIWIYKNRPEVKSVVHMHPEYSLLAGITGMEIYPIYGPYRGGGAALANKGIPIYQDSRTIGTPEQGKDFAECMGDRDVALMVGHGMASAGDSIERSSMNALALETLCRTYYKAYLIGTPRRLPEGELRGPGEPLPEGRRTRGSAGGIEGTMASWRYYVQHAEDILGHRITRDD